MRFVNQTYLIFDPSQAASCIVNFSYLMHSSINTLFGFFFYVLLLRVFFFLFVRDVTHI